MAGIDNNTLLYLRGDSFNDLSLSPKTVTNNGTIISDNGKHYKCIENPKDEQVSIVLEDFQFKGKDNFTIEWWEFLSTSSSKNSTHCIFYNSSNLSKDWEGLMIITWNSQRRIYLSSTGTSWDLVKEGIIGEHILNKWVHRAVVRNGNLILSFQNGKKTNEFSIGDKSIYNNGTNKSMLYNAVFDVYSPQRIENLRISNIARYTEDFTPPTQPYNSITINKTNQTDTNIEFNIEKLGQETINKVEVLVNGTVSETYSDNYDSVNYLIDTELCMIGNNDITIRVTFDDIYTEELSLTHKVTIDELPLETPLLDTVERVKLLTKSKQNEKTILSNILTSKNVEVTEEDKMSDLIGKVGELPSMVSIAKLQENQEIIENKISILTEENEKLKQELTLTQDAVNEILFMMMNMEGK